jgi:hypothetical protein
MPDDPRPRRKIYKTSMNPNTLYACVFWASISVVIICIIILLLTR